MPQEAEVAGHEGDDDDGALPVPTEANRPGRCLRGPGVCCVCVCVCVYYIQYLYDIRFLSSLLFQLCKFFRSENFSSSFQGVAGMNPVLARRFLNRIKKCTKSPEELSQQLERCVCSFIYLGGNYIQTVSIQFII